jgi:hypothetical protein
MLAVLAFCGCRSEDATESALAETTQAQQLASSLAQGNVRVSTHDFFPGDPYAAPQGPADVLQQNEPSIAVHPTDETLVAVGMNDVRTLAVSDDSWQSLAVSTNGGRSFDFEALIPGFPGDLSPEGLASPIRGNEAASDPWAAFDNFGNLFFAFIAFQRTPPGRPDFDPQETNAVAVAKYGVNPVAYQKTVVVERGTVGLGRQEDKEAMVVDNSSASPHHGNIYVCWARFTGFQDHLKVARSTDHGESYAISEVASAVNLQGCSLAVGPSGEVYVSWRTFDLSPRTSNAQDSAVFVARSTNGGAAFGPPVRVAKFIDYQQSASRTPTPAFRMISMTAIAADANGVYVAWHEKSAQHGAQVRISRSKTSGATWEVPVTPHSDSGHQIVPALAAAGGKLSVVWYDSRSEPSFTPTGPVSGFCPEGATSGTGCTGMDVFYNQADTGTPGPLTFGTELPLTSQSFNPNLFATVKAVNPFIGDYIGVAATATTAYAVWADNRDINPTANALEDLDASTDPPALINDRSRDANIYFQRVEK